MSDEFVMTKEGWHEDPTGEFAWRWHDGESWTASVTDDAGMEYTSPMPLPIATHPYPVFPVNENTAAVIWPVTPAAPKGFTTHPSPSDGIGHKPMFTVKPVKRRKTWQIVAGAIGAGVVATALTGLLVSKINDSHKVVMAKASITFPTTTTTVVGVVVPPPTVATTVPPTTLPPVTVPPTAPPTAPPTLPPATAPRYVPPVTYPPETAYVPPVTSPPVTIHVMSGNMTMDGWRVAIEGSDWGPATCASVTASGSMDNYVAAITATMRETYPDFPVALFREIAMEHCP